MNSNSESHNNTVPMYSSEENSIELIEKTRKKKIDKKWMKVKDFPTLGDAQQEIIDGWAICSSTSNLIHYRCNKVKARGEQCASGVKIELHTTSLSVTLYASENEHTCLAINSKSTVKTMTPEVKEIIKEHFLNGLKTKRIEDKLIAAKIRLPSKNQMNNYIAELKKQYEGRPTLSMAELNEVLEKNSTIPSDENHGFVLCKRIIEEPEIGFTFLVSSKKLMGNATKSKVACADTTHKLLWQGFLVQVIGNTDGNKSFHPSGIAVSTNEQTEDFAFIFKGLKEAVKELLGVDLQPKVIMSDAAKAIPNAFMSVYSDDIIELMCWYHMKVAAEAKIRFYFPKNLQDEVIRDLEKLQLSQNPKIFEKSSNLFLEKYEAYAEFIDYFTEQWLVLHRNWYEGACVKSTNEDNENNKTNEYLKAPSTNNALESFNKSVKAEKTLRERLSLENFINQLMTWIKQWSDRYDEGATVFLEDPKIDLPLLTKSYQWTRLNKEVKRSSHGNFLMVPAEGATDLKEWHQIYEWDTFDEFKENAFKGYCTVVPEEDWIKGTCTCPAFFKQYICKHIVGLAIRLKYLTVPIEAKQIPIGSKRKRGRPSKAKRALLLQ